MNIAGLTQLGELIGVPKERIEQALSPELQLMNMYKNSTGKEQHKLMLNHFTITTERSFKNVDIVECDMNLLNKPVLDRIWENINVFSYDIENFFLDKMEFRLMQGNQVLYNAFFEIIDKKNIYMYISMSDIPYAGGTIMVQDGRFIPKGFINEVAYNVMGEGGSHDMDTAASNLLMNMLMYIIQVNQLVNMDKEVITETSRRVDLPRKNKKAPKRTKQVRYIKVDAVKVRRVRESIERQQREAYERHTEEWGKRGHWRTYKSGKRVWVKPTTCKAQTKVGVRVQKIYKVQ